MEKEYELTLEGKAAMRKYMLHIVALPGIGFVIISFLLGFFVNDVAKSVLVQRKLEKSTFQLSYFKYFY